MRNIGIVLIGLIVKLVPQDATRNPRALIYAAEKLFVTVTAGIFAVGTTPVESALNVGDRVLLDEIFPAGKITMILVILLKGSIQSHNIRCGLDLLHARIVHRDQP